jgi:hypothetical protein
MVEWVVALEVNPKLTQTRDENRYVSSLVA